MLDKVVEKRISELEAICEELPLVYEKQGWSDYALSLFVRMQRLVLVFDDPDPEIEIRLDGMLEALRDAWITTENGHKVHFNGNGEPDKGNSHVLNLIKGAVEKNEAEESKKEQRRKVQAKYPRRDNMVCEEKVEFENAGAVTKDKLGRKVTHFNHDEDKMKVTRQVEVMDGTGRKFKICRGEIEHLTIFAADGVGRGLDVADKMAEQVGGSAKSWKHSKGIGTIIGVDGKQRKADLHWFESPESGQVGWKIKQMVEDMDESTFYW